MKILLEIFLNIVIYISIIILYLIYIKILNIGGNMLKKILIVGEYIESSIKEYIFVPLSIWKREKMKVLLWGVFTVGVSMSGIIFDNFFKVRKGGVADWLPKGDFYIISLSLLACSLNTILVEEVEWARDKNVEIKHKNIKIVVQILIMLLILLNIMLYATAKEKDYIQIIIFILVLLICFYVFCVDLIKRYEEYNDLGEYVKKEDESVKKLKEKADDLSMTSEGVRL